MKIYKFAEIAFAIGGIMAFVASWIMSFWLWNAMPTTPDVKNGFVVRMINHGHIIYLSRYHEILFSVLFWGGFVLFFAAVLIDLYKDPFQRRNMKR